VSLKYSIGFLIASLVQAAIVMAAEGLNISSLDAKLTPVQLLIHILTGQVVGYLLLVIMRNVKSIARMAAWVLGSAAGTIVWFVTLYVNSQQGKVNAPWNQGLPTILSSLLAFIVFGILVVDTIKRHNYNMTPS